MRKSLALIGLALPLFARAGPEAQAQALLDAMRELSGVPGMAAAVWRDGRLRWQGVSGWRDVEQRLPVQADTRFRLASVSKVFAAVAVVQLQAAGRLDVDAPVGPLLPELAPPLVALTPRQLAAHLSGLPHYEWRDAGRGRVHHASARDALGHLEGRPLLSAPGSRYHYSSWGYTLLAATAEAAAGRPYLELLAREVAPGLDIGPDETGRSSAMSQAYVLGGAGPQPAPAHDFSYSLGGAGLAASAPALAAWGGRLLQGRVVGAAAREAMWQPNRDGAGQPVGERDFRVGFGWRIGADAEGRRLVHHAGSTLGARSVLLLWPQEAGEVGEGGSSVALLANAMWTSAIERSAELLSAPLREPLPGLAEAPCPVQAGRFEGELDGQPIQGLARFERDAEGLCRGELGLPAPLAAAVNRAPQPAAARLFVIGLQGGLARAALVTPIGLADWRAQADGSHVVGDLAGHRLVMRMR